MEELLKKCDNCNGDGYLTSKEWIEWFKETKETKEKGLPEPEQPSSPEEYPCPECEGTGKIPTDTGKQIIELIFWAIGERLDHISERVDEVWHHSRVSGS